MVKKILAVVLAFALAFAFAACGKDDAADVPSTTDANAGVSLGDSLGERPTQEPQTEIATEVATNAEGQTEIVTEIVTEAPTEAAKAPEGKEEIVAYFNEVINSAKKDSKSIKSNYMIHSVYADQVTGVPGLVDTLLGGTGNFIDGFMGPDDSKANVTWTSAADKNAFFPVEGEEWASKLTAADVSSAQIGWTDDGNYLIVIKTVPDGKSADVKHGSGHAPKVFNVVMPAVVSDNIPGVVAKAFNIGTVTMNYPSGTVSIVVDPDTNQVLTANYKMNWTINIPLGDNNVVLPFMTENDYVINW